MCGRCAQVTRTSTDKGSGAIALLYVNVFYRIGGTLPNRSFKKAERRYFRWIEHMGRRISYIPHSKRWEMPMEICVDAVPLLTGAVSKGYRLE